MINNVVLVGRLTRDVDVRYTQSGVAVGSFSVAVERNFKMPKVNVRQILLTVLSGVKQQRILRVLPVAFISRC